MSLKLIESTWTFCAQYLKKYAQKSNGLTYLGAISNSVVVPLTQNRSFVSEDAKDLKLWLLGGILSVLSLFGMELFKWWRSRHDVSLQDLKTFMSEQTKAMNDLKLSVNAMQKDLGYLSHSKVDEKDLPKKIREELDYARGKGQQ